MPEQAFRYIVVGGGLAGASAVQGIRERDQKGGVLLIGEEEHLPYDRPPLSKKLWFGKMKLDEIFVKDRDFYDRNGVSLMLGSRVVGLDAARQTIIDDRRRTYRFEKLLLATGGVPRRLPIPGADLKGVCYYRYLDDYLRVRAEAQTGRTAIVIGGGFIGSEIAAALTMQGLLVTMIFLDPYLCSRVFPESLGKAVGRHFLERGITVLAGESPASIERAAGGFRVRTAGGRSLEASLVIVGVGIRPETEPAEAAGLTIGNGIIVDEYLRTSHPNIFAAGDNANFSYSAIGRKTRVEHWDNALNQGRWAGRNMAGAEEAFTYMPYFFSDLFEFGYEAVGDVSTDLEIFTDWKTENDTGVIYYLRDGRVRGAMMCNVWDKVEAARALIRREGRVAPQDLRGAIG